MTNYSYQWLKECPIAHRGLHSGDEKIPENSLKAFQNAINYNFPIEVDIQFLSDDNIVVFHDENLFRMCSQNLFLKDLNLDEVKEFNLLNSSEKIPTLQEVLNLVKGAVPILIEIKNQKHYSKKHPLLMKLIDQYTGPLAIQSFNPFILQTFRKHNPKIYRGQLSSDFKEDKMNCLIKYLLKNLYFNIFSRPNFISYDIKAIPNARVHKMRQKGLPILCWTINEESNYKKKQSHFDNIIFENIKLCTK